MASWTDIDVNSLLPGQPLTSAIALAYEENPRAIAEGALGAPKVADKTAWGSGASVTFSNLDDYQGIFIKGGASNVAGSGILANIEFSDDDGATFSTIVDLFDSGVASAAADWYAHFELFLDFATGNIRSVGSSTEAIVGINDTLAGASLDITDVRVSAGGDLRVMAIPQGGESAS